MVKLRRSLIDRQLEELDKEIEKAHDERTKQTAKKAFEKLTNKNKNK